MTRIAAVVLAAGRGERLGGAAKAALRLPDGRTFLEAVAEAARAGGCARVIAVAAAPHLQAVRAAAAAAGVEVVENPAPERGMASSAAIGLAALDGGAFDAALVWPVDHSRVGAATVAAIAAAAARDRIVVPRRAGRGGHPTAFGAGLWPECAVAAAGPDGLRAVVAADRRRVAELAVDDDGVVRDVDTPDDYARIGGSGPLAR